MIHASIKRIDAQAQGLLQLLTDSDNVLRAYLDADRLAVVARAREAVENLRQALLGAEMGPLYWGAESGEPTLPPGPESPPSPAD